MNQLNNENNTSLMSAKYVGPEDLVAFFVVFGFTAFLVADTFGVDDFGEVTLGVDIIIELYK